MKNIIETINSLNFKFWIIICISLSLIIRLILISYFFPDNSYLTFSDQSKYIYRSDLILKGEFFSEAWGALRMPIYPIFLAVIKFIYSDLFLVIVIQNILLLFSYYYIIKFNNFFSTFTIKSTAFNAQPGSYFIPRCITLYYGLSRFCSCVHTAEVGICVVGSDRKTYRPRRNVTQNK